MSELFLACISATTFTKTGEIDEEAFRRHLNRIIDAKIGVFLGSGGNGESHALTPDELRRIYEIGVEECKGKVPIQAHLPEEGNARTMIDQARIAVAAGVEVVQIYTPEGRHGFKPTDTELAAYYDQILSEIKHPASIVISTHMGYIPRAEIIAEICRKHQQIVAVLLARTPDTYLLDLKGVLNQEVSVYGHFITSSMNGLALGVNGMFMAEANIIPKTARRFVELHQTKKLDDMHRVVADISRFSLHVRKWGPAGARWIKMAMRVLKLPGGQGGVRPPYLMPSEDELRKFVDGLLRLGIPEVEEMLRVANLTTSK